MTLSYFHNLKKKTKGFNPLYFWRLLASQFVCLAYLYLCTILMGLWIKVEINNNKIIKFCITCIIQSKFNQTVINLNIDIKCKTVHEILRISGPCLPSPTFNILTSSASSSNLRFYLICIHFSFFWEFELRTESSNVKNAGDDRAKKNTFTNLSPFFSGFPCECP